MQLISGTGLIKHRKAAIPLVPTVLCPLPAVQCPLSVAHCLLLTIYCTLLTDSSLSTVHCTLFSAYSPLSTANWPLCMLYTCCIFGSISYLTRRLLIKGNLDLHSVNTDSLRAADRKWTVGSGKWVIIVISEQQTEGC